MPRGKPVDADLRAEIIQMFDAELPIPQISHETGVSVPTVYKILGEAGRTNQDSLPRKFSRMAPETLDELIRAYRDSGEPVVNILNRFGITHTELYALLRESGIQVRANANMSDNRGDIDRAIALYTDESRYYPLWEIEQLTGVTAQRLNRYAHRLGVPLRRPRGGVFASVPQPPKETTDV